MNPEANTKLKLNPIKPADENAKPKTIGSMPVFPSLAKSEPPSPAPQPLPQLEPTPQPTTQPTQPVPPVPVPTPAEPTQTPPPAPTLPPPEPAPMVAPSPAPTPTPANPFLSSGSNAPALAFPTASEPAKPEKHSIFSKAKKTSADVAATPQASQPAPPVTPTPDTKIPQEPYELNFEQEQPANPEPAPEPDLNAITSPLLEPSPQFFANNTEQTPTNQPPTELDAARMQELTMAPQFQFLQPAQKIKAPFRFKKEPISAPAPLPATPEDGSVLPFLAEDGSLPMPPELAPQEQQQDLLKATPPAPTEPPKIEFGNAAHINQIKKTRRRTLAAIIILLALGIGAFFVITQVINKPANNRQNSGTPAQATAIVGPTLDYAPSGTTSTLSIYTEGDTISTDPLDVQNATARSTYPCTYSECFGYKEVRADHQNLVFIKDGEDYLIYDWNEKRAQKLTPLAQDAANNKSPIAGMRLAYQGDSVFGIIFSYQLEATENQSGNKAGFFSFTDNTIKVASDRCNGIEPLNANSVVCRQHDGDNPNLSVFDPATGEVVFARNGAGNSQLTMFYYPYGSGFYTLSNGTEDWLYDTNFSPALADKTLKRPTYGLINGHVVLMDTTVGIISTYDLSADLFYSSLTFNSVGRIISERSLVAVIGGNNHLLLVNTSGQSVIDLGEIPDGRTPVKDGDVWSGEYSADKLSLFFEATIQEEQVVEPPTNTQTPEAPQTPGNTSANPTDTNPTDTNPTPADQPQTTTRTVTYLVRYSYWYDFVTNQSGIDETRTEQK